MSSTSSICLNLKILLRAALCWFLASTFSPTAMADGNQDPLDLGTGTWWIQPDFKPGDEVGFDEHGSNVRILDGLKAYPNRIFATSPDHTIRDYALMHHFLVPESLAQGEKSHVIHIGMLGEQWEVFINGHLVIRRFDDHPTSNELTPMVEYKVRGNIPVDALKPGMNTLVLHLRGHAPLVGFSTNVWFRFGGPVLLSTGDAPFLALEDKITFAIYAVYMFFGLYHLLLFAKRRHEKHNLYFAAVCLLTLTQGLGSESSIYHLFADSEIPLRLLLCGGALLGPAVVLFLHSYFTPKEPLAFLARFILWGSFVITIPVIFFAFRWVEPSSSFSRMVIAPAMIIWVPWYFTKVIRRRIPDAALMAVGTGTLMLTVGAMATIGWRLNLNTPIQAYGMFAWMMGLVVMMANRYTRIHQAAENLNRDLVKSHGRLQNVLLATQNMASAQSETAAEDAVLKIIRQELEFGAEEPLHIVKRQREPSLQTESKAELQSSPSKGTQGNEPMTITIPNTEGVDRHIALARPKQLFSQSDLDFCDTVASSFAIVLENLKRAEETAQAIRMENALLAARVVQTQLLPKQISIPGVQIAHVYQPADEAGGDWFHYRYDQVQGQLFFCIGDVTGHGVGAAILTGVACGAVQAAVRLTGSLHAEERIQQLSKLVDEVIADTRSENLAMTMFFGMLDIETGNLTYVNAGHLLPIVCGPERERAREIKPNSGRRLGFGANIPYQVKTETLKPGDRLLFYTDGLIENTGPALQVLSKHTLLKELSAKRNVSAHEILSHVLAIGKETWLDQPPEDDLAAAVICWERTSQGQVANA